MLALLSAPRGRVSAARVAARMREDERAEARRTAIRLPGGTASSVTQERQPRTSITRDEREA